MTHTPTPWTLGTGSETAKNHAVCHNATIIAKVLGCGYPTGKGWGPQSQSNAALIVRAVNSHDKLVAELAMLVRKFKACLINGGTDEEFADEAVKSAMAALAEAKGN